MQYMVLVYESPGDLESRDKPAGDAYLAAWRAYHKALAEAGVQVTGAPLKQVATADDKCRMDRSPKPRRSSAGS
jgi:hypothetical protein